MLKRFYLISALVAALGAGVAAATVADQKDKQKEKAANADSQKKKELEKEKGLLTPSSESRAFFAMPFGEGSYLGVFLEEVTTERVKDLGLSEERGAIVMKVVEGGPADKAGLKENDVVVSFNGRRVDSVRELQRLLSETPAERAISIEVIRGGSHQTLNATLSKRSQEFHLLRPELADKEAMRRAEEKIKRSYESLKSDQDREAMRHAEEEFKRSFESFKTDQERLRAFPPDFGNFAFVAPGQYSFFGGSRLGVSVESLTDQLAEFFGVKDGHGVLVSQVTENSPAAKAGLKAGDVIIAIDNERIDGVNALVKAVSKKEVGPIAVKILRNRVEQTVNVTIEKREELPSPRRRASVAASAVSSI
ncbi:MAG: PDZ domain-containing protein [Acidobacteriota bacterium]